MAARRGAAALLLLVLVLAPRALSDSLQHVVTLRDQERLKQLLLAEDNWSDLRVAYLAVKGLEGLGVAISPEYARKACDSVETPETLEAIFYASSLSKALGKHCKVTISGVESTLKAQLKDGASITNLYYTTIALSNFGISFDKYAAYLLLQKAVDDDDTPAGAGLAFKTAAVLSDEDVDVLTVSEMVEDIINQADESDNTLSFESGLAVTSSILVGTFDLSETLKATPEITEEQLIKISNYLLMNRFTESVETASYMLEAVGILSRNKFYRPSALLLANNRPVTESNPNLIIRFTDILGRALEKANVKATSIDDADGETILTKKQLTVDKDGVTYSISLFDSLPQSGAYTVQMSAILQGNSVAFDIPDATVPIIVSEGVTVTDTKLSIIDREQGVSSLDLSMQYPETVKNALSADYHQKVVMSFSVVGTKRNEPVNVHQAFVMLKLNAQEVFFVATADDAKRYTFELDVSTAGKDSFGHMSGTYSMSLIIGDYSVEQPFVWEICSIALKFSGTPAVQKAKQDRVAKPEILHVFREPDKRAPATISTIFTGLALSPILILLILWIALGANISNLLDSGLWGILFHIGLVGIFSLFFCFWLQLNMFQTLWYLSPLGVFTFFAGNRMLRYKASRQMKT